MLLSLFAYLAQFYSGFHAFEYLSLRAILTVITSLGFCLLVGPWFIARLRQLKYGQAVRNDGPQTHMVKQGTPTMGGIMILVSIMLSVLLWTDLSNAYIWIVLAVMCIFGVVGWLDDWLKIKHKNPAGLAERYKFAGTSFGALFVGVTIAWLAYHSPDPNAVSQRLDLLLPVFKNYIIPLSVIPMGMGFIVLTYFVINGASNAVNLTDGLDGLAILPVILVAAGLGVFAFVSGSAQMASYLHVPHVAMAGELVVVCAAMVGAGLGFLWFNAYPAEVFMGDVGALTLGAMLGTIAVMVRQELAFFIMAGVFVAEAVSVILQRLSYKLRGGKRIFLMAPVHHHFELKGWKETQVVVRFWIITIILVLVGLATLKIR